MLWGSAPAAVRPAVRSGRRGAAGGQKITDPNQEFSSAAELEGSCSWARNLPAAHGLNIELMSSAKPRLGQRWRCQAAHETQLPRCWPWAPCHLGLWRGHQFDSSESFLRGFSLAWLHSEPGDWPVLAAGRTGWTPDQSLALAPPLSADPADRIIVALDGMAPEQAVLCRPGEGTALGEGGTGVVRPGRLGERRSCGSRAWVLSTSPRHPGHDGTACWRRRRWGPN